MSEIVFTPSDVIAVVRNREDMIEAFRTIKGMLGLTNGHCDELANMTEGHTDKCLGPSEEKEIGPLTFSRFCWLFGVQFEMRIDLEQVKAMQEYWEDRQRKRPFELGHNSRVSKKLIERAKPHVLRAHLKSANAARNAMLSCEHKSRIARKAAKARWRKNRSSVRRAAGATA